MPAECLEFIVMERHCTKQIASPLVIGQEPQLIHIKRRNGHQWFQVVVPEEVIKTLIS